jgi:hypothetical protein
MGMLPNVWTVLWLFLTYSKHFYLVAFDLLTDMFLYLVAFDLQNIPLIADWHVITLRR